MQPQQPQVIVVNNQSQVVPALLNAFCWPGLGQLIQGRLLAALAWIFLWICAGVLCFVGIGFFILPIVWILAIVDAANYNPMRRGGMLGGLLLAAIAGGVVLVGLFAFAVLGVGLLAVGGGAQQTASNQRNTTAPSDDGSGESADDSAMIPLSGDETTEVPETSDDRASPPPTVAATPDPPSPVQLVEPTPPTKPEKPEEPKVIRLRRFTSGDGSYSVMARFVQAKDNFVQLRKTDGGLVPVRIDKLSPEDQEHLREAIQAKADYDAALAAHENDLAQYESDLAGYEKALEAYEIQQRLQREAQEAEQRRKREAAEAAKREKLAKLELSYAGFSNVKSGMTFEEVVALLGLNYEESSRVELPGVPTTVLVTWKARSGFGNCNVTFQSGRVVSKAQFGLK